MGLALESELVFKHSAVPYSLRRWRGSRPRHRLHRWFLRLCFAAICSIESRIRSSALTGEK
ncbi:hypothetical protein JCM18916_3072 [Cutibacterium acnes JCM 18916]|nr:hypothetical protein JCM18916_3072 [Cutibacterium acnes JCM 18916]GAE74881.1 hypothetical protein JCM18918_542 [Cutibacterium acnes JCM 18918]